LSGRFCVVSFEDLLDIARPVEHALDEQCRLSGVVENKVALKSTHAPDMAMLKMRVM
jgi:hypothetical protein